MKTKMITGLLLLLLLPLLLYSQGYESLRVASVDIVPQNQTYTTAFNAATVKARMQTKSGNYFSQSEFDADLKMLASEYDQIEPLLCTRNNQLCITLHVWFKPTIRSIIFCGNERMKEKKLLKTLDLECGSLFERELFVNAVNSLRTFYVKKGYFETEIDYEIVPVEENQVDIRITLCEGRAGRIGEISFSGLTPAEESALLALLVTRKHNFFLSWLTGQGVYHPEMIEHDRIQIINYFQNCGFADVFVDIAIQNSEKKDKIGLLITVNKGESYSIGNLCIAGNTLFSSELIRSKFILADGACYSPEELRNCSIAINDLYGCAGYIDTNVDLQLALRPDCPVYDVNVRITEGEQYYVGLIKVFGNSHTQPRVILHESLLCPGEVFDNRKLQGTEARLLNTGYFEAVNVYAVRSQIGDPDHLRNYRDIYIEVEEADTGNLGLFGGFSSIDRIFVGFEITERNFNLAGIPRLVEWGPGALRGGGEFAHAKVNIGDKQTSYLFQWTKPYFLDTPWLFGIDLEKSNNRALSKAYELKTYGGNVHGTYIINPFLKYDLHYRARHTHASLYDKKNPLLVKEGSHGGFISAIGGTLIYDSTNNPRRASYGLRSRLLYELAGIGGNYQFMRFGYLNSYYYPLSPRGTLKFRGDLLFIKTYGSTGATDMPLSERLYLGGETTVRGYRNFIIGPKFGNNEPRGGMSSYLLSAEYLHNLLPAPCLDAFVFIDAGYVSFSEFTVGSPSASAGFGVRVEIMQNMPLMIGYGWPFRPTEIINGHVVDNTQRFFFAMGGCF